MGGGPAKIRRLQRRLAARIAAAHAAGADDAKHSAAGTAATFAAVNVAGADAAPPPAAATAATFAVAYFSGAAEAQTRETTLRALLMSLVAVLLGLAATVAPIAGTEEARRAEYAVRALLADSVAALKGLMTLSPASVAETPVSACKCCGKRIDGHGLVARRNNDMGRPPQS